MSPEAYSAARKRIELHLVDARRKFIIEWKAARSRLGSRGGSTELKLLARQCTEEYNARALMAWQAVRTVLDSEGWRPADNNIEQIRSLIEFSVNEGSEDLQEHFIEAAGRIRDGQHRSLDDRRRHAVDSAIAEAEIDLLRRKARRLPLDDELSATRYRSVKDHWQKGLRFADQEPPDLPNAVKEVVSSVEALAKIAAGKDGITLGDAIKLLRSTKRLPVGADKVLEGLYAFASDSPGVRHGSALKPHVDPTHWDFARVSAEAALRLLLDIDA